MSLPTVERVNNAANMESERVFEDPQGREVSLSSERWQHIIDAHPELSVQSDDVIRAVESPTTASPGRARGEEWLCLEGSGRAGHVFYDADADVLYLRVGDPL